MPIHVFTSVTSNYVPKARVLARSIKRLHPEWVFHLVLAEAVPEWLQVHDEPFDSIVGVNALGIRNPEQWTFKHSVVEACTGVKGFAAVKLLGIRDCSAVLYFDPDIVVLSSGERLVSEFDNAPVLLTPHLTEPERTTEAILDNEFSVLQHGIYNLGFLGVKNSEEGRRFAEWWADRLDKFCYDDIPRGIFTDQRWADLAPAYFNGVRILRNPGYNVCTWNLTHRKVEGSLSRGFTANGEPLVFYHFSGLDSGAQRAMLDKYGSRMPALYELRDWYLGECDRMGQEELGFLPWSFSAFDNGRKITPLHRKLYRDNPDLQKAFPNPYSTGNPNRSYYHWFERNGESRGGNRATYTPVLPALVPAAAPEPLSNAATGAPSYRIFLSIRGADAGAALEAARELFKNSYNTSALYVAGTDQELEALFADSEIRNAFRPFAVPLAPDHDAVFQAVAAAWAREADFVFITPEVVIPEGWDLRLAWTAKRLSGVATVSPINDLCPTTRLAVDGMDVSIDQMDRACYAASLFANPEIPVFLPHCAYVNHRAVAETGPLGIAAFSQDASARRWSHLVADHIYTGTRAPCELNRSPGDDLPAALTVLRQQITQHPTSTTGKRPRGFARRQLHVMHSWGGGLERWVQEYCRADCDHDNLVLKSVGAWGAFGQELQLFRSIDDPIPVRSWPLSPAIKHTAGFHTGYRAALSEIADEYGIDVVIVSSLIGHSLEAFRTGLQTMMVCHDFYPLCPALNLTFETLCQSCGQSDLDRCTLNNPHNRFFRNVPASEWAPLRKDFSSAVKANGIRIIAPSASVQEHYTRFMPELQPYFQVIPHGSRPIENAPLKLEPGAGRKLRIVVLGSLAAHKGAELLAQALPDLLQFAELHLLGCGPDQKHLGGNGVHVIPEYEWAELPGLLASIRPDVGLLLSVVPETFSFTLQELFELGVPVVATRLGSFADRILDGETGFLVDPDPHAVVDVLRRLSDDRGTLAAVHRRLCSEPPRRMGQMLADYEAAIGMPSLSERAYFARESRGVRALATATLNLRWQTGDHAIETDSSTIHMACSNEQATAVLNVPPAPVSGTMGLRLCFDAGPAAIILHEARLADLDSRTLWCWSNRTGHLKPRDFGDVLMLRQADGLLYFSGPEPFIELPTGPETFTCLRGGGTLELQVSYPSIDQALARMAHAVVSSAHDELTPKERKSVLHLISSRMHEGNGAGGSTAVPETLLRQLTEARARVTALEQSLSWRITAPLRRGSDFLSETILRRR